MRFALLVLLASMGACTSKQDVLNTTPLLDRTYKGDYEAVAACTLNGIQTSYSFIAPNVLYVPVLSQRYIEIQTTATSGFTGTIFGAVTRLEDIDGSSFRAVVRATYTADGDVAIEALTNCVEQ